MVANEEKVKTRQNEIKKNIQGTNREGEETRTQINGLEQKEETNQNRMKKQKFKKKNEERLLSLIHI